MPQDTLQKMHTQLVSDVAHYQLPVGDELIDLNPFIGLDFTLNHTGVIRCKHCGKKTRKSYSQGFCYVCMNKLAQCDLCIMKPETCHYAKGTCREPSWGDQHCNIEHFVYLSNTSGIKVGITRHTQLPTRWIDQGATQGLTILKTKSRYISGLVEVEFAKHIADKTHWQAMLKGNAEDIDLKSKATELIAQVQLKLDDICQSHGSDSIERLDNPVQSIRYPVEKFPQKVKSLNFDKDPFVSGTLQGIKGQYLIFDTGVINIRKFSSYEVEIL